MRTMKDSGIAWIGEIPDDWRIIRNKNAFTCSKELVGEKSELTQLLSLTTRGIKKKDINNAEGKLPESFDTYQFVKENDLVMCLFDLDCSAVFSGISPYNGMISPAYRVLSCKKCMEPKYADYWFQYISDGRKFNHYAKNIRYTLSYEEFSALPLLLPERNEQRRIADYLDRKCSQIDAIIARQQEVIEKLKAYKLSIITEAVTKGLNPDVPMKDSGVERIGEIPEHWKMVRLKFLLSQIIDCPHETPIYSADGDYLVIRTADQDLGKLRADEDMYRLDAGEYQNRIRRMPLEKDDIVYGREGERWGLACLVPESNRYCLGQRMLQFRCKRELFLPRFAMWALNSKFVYLQGAVDTIGSTSPHVNISTVRNFLIPVPPISEQQEIAEYIDKKMSQLDKEIEHRENLICKLNEYKKSLIYEVVTGKQEV